MVLEQGALTGVFDTDHPFPKNSERGQVYNPLLPKLEALNAQIKEIADKYGVGIPQIPVAWAIAKGTLPIVGATKTKHVYDAPKAYQHHLTTDHFKTYKQGTLHMVKDLKLVDTKALNPSLLPDILKK